MKCIKILHYDEVKRRFIESDGSEKDLLVLLK